MAKRKDPNVRTFHVLVRDGWDLAEMWVPDAKTLPEARESQAQSDRLGYFDWQKRPRIVKITMTVEEIPDKETP